MDFQWEGGPVHIEKHNDDTPASVKSFNRAYGKQAPQGGTQLVVVETPSSTFQGFPNPFLWRVWCCA